MRRQNNFKGKSTINEIQNLAVFIWSYFKRQFNACFLNLQQKLSGSLNPQLNPPDGNPGAPAFLVLVTVSDLVPVWLRPKENIKVWIGVRYY